MGETIECETAGEIHQEYNLPMDAMQRRLNELRLGMRISTMPRCDLCHSQAPVKRARLYVCIVCGQKKFRNRPGVPSGGFGRCNLCQNHRYLYEMRDIRTCQACEQKITVGAMCKRF